MLERDFSFCHVVTARPYPQNEYLPKRSSTSDRKTTSSIFLVEVETDMVEYKIGHHKLEVERANH